MTPFPQLGLPGTHSCHTIPPRIRGFTLVELVCTIGIVAILSAIAVPELGQLRRAAARRAVVNDFFHSIFLARSKAIMLNGVVSICRSHDGTFCENRSSNWEGGWIVFINTDRDRGGFAVRDRSPPRH